jgi:predicted PurR-regulated permease PerM
MVKNQQRIEQIAGIILIGAIVVGCWLVLRLFMLAILWAAILCFATWPVHELLLKWLRGRRTLTAALMTFILLLVLFVPFLVVGLTFTESIRTVIEWLDTQQKSGLPPAPAWVEKIPLIGSTISEYWSRLGENAEPALNWLKPWLKEVGLWLLRHSIGIAQGLFNLAMSLLIAFFLYRDGEGIVVNLREGFRRISGDYAQHLIDVVKATVRSVVYGVIGTALAQGAVAGIGFAIAGVPWVMLLALFTFFFSFIPGGPPIIWIGVSIWLFTQGHTGWGIFMILYGVLAISMVDNVIKPYIISRGTKLSFIVMLIGMLGGIAAFGFIGVFLGPTLLAVGFSLAHEIITQRQFVKSASQGDGSAV